MSNADLSGAKINDGSADAKSQVGVEFKLDIPTDLDRPNEGNDKEDIDLKIEKKRLRVINQAKD